MSAVLWAVLALAGLLATLVGVGGLFVTRRLYEGLRNEPFHREGDATAAYLPGCSGVLLALGLVALGLGCWQLW